MHQIYGRNWRLANPVWRSISGPEGRPGKLHRFRMNMLIGLAMIFGANCALSVSEARASALRFHEPDLARTNVLTNALLVSQQSGQMNQVKRHQLHQGTPPFTAGEPAHYDGCAKESSRSATSDSPGQVISQWIRRRAAIRLSVLRYSNAGRLWRLLLSAS